MSMTFGSLGLSFFALDGWPTRLPNGRLYAVIRNANHFSFSDQTLINSQVAVHL